MCVCAGLEGVMVMVALEAKASGDVVDAKFNLMPNKAKLVVGGESRSARNSSSSSSSRDNAVDPTSVQTFQSRSSGITMRSFIGMLLGLLTISETSALRLLGVRIPAYVFRGESALLECQYELDGQQSRTQYYYPQSLYHSSRWRNQNESFGSSKYARMYHDGYYNSMDSGSTGKERLYSIKWYRDNEEFYRYVPSANPPIKSYKIDGIRVDPNHSDGTKVLLKSVTLKSSGMYKCEVSAEAPNFDSIQGEGRLTVIVSPKDPPHINGSEHKSYQVGQTMEVNCTSGRSFPASTLQWYMNDHLVTDPRTLLEYPRTMSHQNLFTATLGLKVIVQPQHFIEGVIRLKCIASYPPLLWRNGKESIVQREQPAVGERVAMLLVKSGSSRRLVGANLLLLLPLLLGCTLQ